MGGGLRTWNFPGVLKKENVEIPGVNQKRSGISVMIKKKSGGIPSFLIFVLEFPSGATKLCGISKG